MNHVNVEEYEEYRRNDLVSIKGQQGVFKFMWVAFREEKPVWVEVYGPLGQYRQYRSFELDRLKPVSKAKAKLLGNKNQ